METISVFYCQKPSHFKKDCPAFNKLRTGDKKDRRIFRRSQKALLTEERNKIQIQLDALDVETDSEYDNSDDSTLPSPELCGVTHDIIDFGLKKNEMCGVAEIDGPDISNIEICLMADEVTHTSCYTYESDE